MTRFIGMFLFRSDNSEIFAAISDVPGDIEPREVTWSLA